MLNGGSAIDFPITRSTADSMKNGIIILKIKRDPIKNGSNSVVKRYTDDAENEATLAMFPVPVTAINRVGFLDEHTKE